MKTYCKKPVITREFVAGAFEDWKGAQAGKKNGWRVEAEHGSPDDLIDEVYREIEGRSLSLRPIRRYKHHEQNSGKIRTLGVESVKQQLCDYVLVKALDPLLSAKIGYWQTASIPGKGVHFSAKAARRWLEDGGWWVHLDIRKCYPSMDTRMVYDLVARYVRDDTVLYLLKELLATYSDGMEIGSYLSLRLVQFVLSFGYHHVEDLHKRRRDRDVRLISHQLWYADDIWLFSPCKRDLKMAARSLQGFLGCFGLSLKPWKVCRADEPMDVAGLKVGGKKRIRGRIYLRAMRACRRYMKRPSLHLAYQVCGWWGWLRYTGKGTEALRRAKRQIRRNDAYRLRRA